jgi:hypothetical protein
MDGIDGFRVCGYTPHHGFIFIDIKLPKIIMHKYEININ